MNNPVAHKGLIECLTALFIHILQNCKKWAGCSMRLCMRRKQGHQDSMNEWDWCLYELNASED